MDYLKAKSSIFSNNAGATNTHAKITKELVLTCERDTLSSLVSEHIFSEDLSVSMENALYAIGKKINTVTGPQAHYNFGDVRGVVNIEEVRHKYLPEPVETYGEVSTNNAFYYIVLAKELYHEYSEIKQMVDSYKRKPTPWAQSVERALVVAGKAGLTMQPQGFSNEWKVGCCTYKGSNAAYDYIGAETWHLISATNDFAVRICQIALITKLNL